MNDFTQIEKWYSGNALETLRTYVSPTLIAAAAAGYWPKGASRKVHAALNKQNVAARFAKANRELPSPSWSWAVSAGRRRQRRQGDGDRLRHPRGPAGRMDLDRARGQRHHRPSSGRSHHLARGNAARHLAVRARSQPLPRLRARDREPYNWVPLVAQTASGPASLWVGADCARNLFNVDVSGQAEYLR